MFNGDIGKIITIDNEALTAIISFYPDNREVQYKKEDIMELDLAYAITIHKSQGSEFNEVLVVLPSEDNRVLCRELLYTAVTRARKRVTVAAEKQVMELALSKRIQRYSGLAKQLQGSVV